MNSQEIPFRFFLKSKQMFNQNFQTDEDQDDTTGDLCVFSKFSADFISQENSDEADEERGDPDQTDGRKNIYF